MASINKIDNEPINIGHMIKNNLIDKQTLEYCIDYELLELYGYYILMNFGSEYFNKIKKTTLNDKLSTISVEDLNLLVNYDLLKNHSENIISRFGKNHYESLCSNYGFSNG